MIYIFMDESGDLGFDFRKKKTSKYFLISFLIVKETKSNEKIIKNIIKSLPKKEIKYTKGILHCYKVHPRIRKKLLTKFVKKDSKISLIYIKKSIKHKLQYKSIQALYNDLTYQLLKRVLQKDNKMINKRIIFIASRKETQKHYNKKFIDYIYKKINQDFKINDIEILIKKPEEQKCLQIVDFICWTIYRKVEHDDDEYYKIIKQKIEEENPL